MRIIAVIFWVAALGSLYGCGPIVSGVQIIKANIALGAAETAGAKKDAPYEYTSAEEYLKKAREEDAYADFSASRDYADRALAFAMQARQKAEQAAQVNQQPVVLPAP